MCINNQCQCASGFVNIGTHSCALKATAIGGPCSVSAQCMNLPGTACDINGNCTCDEQKKFVLQMMLPASAMVGGATDRRKRQAVTGITVMCAQSAYTIYTLIFRDFCKHYILLFAQTFITCRANRAVSESCLRVSSRLLWQFDSIANAFYRTSMSR